MSSIEILQNKQNRKTTKKEIALADEDKRLVEAVLKFGHLGKTAKFLGTTEAEIKQRFASPNVRAILLNNIEQMLLAEHLPAALRYLLRVVRGDVTGTKERVSVAKTLLDRVGLGATKPRDPDKDVALEEMTLAELQSFVASKEAELSVIAPSLDAAHSQATDWLE